MSVNAKAERTKEVTAKKSPLLLRLMGVERGAAPFDTFPG